MRSLVQIQVLVGEIIAIDDDGYLWRGTAIEEGGEWLKDDTGALLAHWEPIRGPDDAQPFLDTRDRLTRIEEMYRKVAKERDALRERFEGLPAAKIES